MPAPSPILVMNDVRCAVSEPKAEKAHPIDLEILPGEIVVAGGTSDSGKSILLCTAAGFEKPRTGTVRLFGTETFAGQASDIFEVRRRTGFVFQQPVFISDLSCLENLLLPLRYDADMDEAQLRKKALEVLALAGLSDLADGSIENLQALVRRRLALARAWIRDPDIVFYDEPAKIFDPIAQRAIYKIIHEYHESRKRSGRPAAAFLSCHDPRWALDWADRFLILEEGALTFNADKTTIRSQRSSFERNFSDSP